MDKLKVRFLMVGLMTLALQMIGGGLAQAANLPGKIVINEVAWAGTADSSNDEWIELYNTGNIPVDLAGWEILDDGSSSYKISAGQIAPHGYFLIEDAEPATGAASDAVIGLSLANAGDSLVLKNGAGEVIDTVNGSGGAWYHGDATSKATMERIDPLSGDVAENWASSIAGNGSLGRSGQQILGTPKMANSNFGGEGPEVAIELPKLEFKHGERLVSAVEVSNVSDLYSYGFEIKYDADVLKFVEAKEGALLKSGNVSTAFSSALQDNVAGNLLVGGARLVNPPIGIDGSGTLFELTFEVIGDNDEMAEIVFAPGSFITDSTGDMQARYLDTNLVVKDQVVSVVSNLTARAGAERYSVEMSWDAPINGADKYLIKKLMPDGNYKDLGETNTTNFIDKDAVIGGGGLIPNLEYSYQVVAVSGGVNSLPVGVKASDNRGVKGDIDRNDRVDGRDIEKLARAYGSEMSDEEYLITADLNFDGLVNGADLVELATNFGLKYKP